jgi:hypothetical protein
VTTQEQFQALVVAEYAQYTRASRILWDARRTKESLSERQRAHWAMTIAAAKFESIKADARAAFAKSRGWRYDKKRYSAPYVQEYGYLSRRIIKNQDVFRDAGRNFVGMITHSAATLEEITAYAERRGFNAEPLPYSWDAPDYHTAVLLTPKAGATWT